MTIQQISDELNFPSQSFFGKYFKRCEGVSPKEYREGWNFSRKRDFLWLCDPKMLCRITCRYSVKSFIMLIIKSLSYRTYLRSYKLPPKT
jgi:hypothetical protein